MDDGVIVGEFQKNAKEVVRVRLTDYAGHKLVDVRAFWTDASTGELRPGKGLCLRRELLPQLIDALTVAEGMAVADGLELPEK